MPIIDYITAENTSLSEREIFIPVYNSPEYTEQISAWEQGWREKMTELEEKIKQLPEYAEVDVSFEA